MLNKHDYDWLDVLEVYAASNSGNITHGFSIDRQREFDKVLQMAFTQCQAFADFVEDAFEYLETHPEKEDKFYG